ncbi:hypothetical protein RRG08_007412 [Elysia crispata]|uniref:Uncharacterized protein n=1 Tax=Elysia crispata TaxID=231223 RepID=A0AAE0ZJ05_9GAST|nr:hypothetical protein RRG08_007412 [Elysia crispata]
MTDLRYNKRVTRSSVDSRELSQS